MAKARPILGATTGLLVNVEVTYRLDDHVHLLGSLGRTVRDINRGGPEALAQVFLQLNF